MTKTPIPITLLSGFLGSGKTTLLERILTSNHGLKVAVIINDVSKINIDASLIKDHKIATKKEKLIQMQNGCICCTLRGDLLEELLNLAHNGEFQYIVIESTGISEPMQVAETFTIEFPELLLQSGETIDEKDKKMFREIVKLGGLNHITALDTCVTIVDAANFSLDIETTQFLSDRYASDNQDESSRTITDLLLDQIEFADVIILNKISSIKKRSLKKIEKMIRALNPVARLLKTDYCKVDLKEVMNTQSYDFEKASTSAGWLHSLNEMNKREDSNSKFISPKPETEEYGINNFVYSSRRPFHPKRLYELIADKFFVIEAVHDGLGKEDDFDDVTERSRTEESDESDEEGKEEEGKEEDDLADEDLVNNKRKSPFKNLLRSKGFLWLATRHIVRGEWSSAGTMLTLKGGIPWFAVTGVDDLDPDAAMLVREEMQGKYGDRRNEIVCIGLGIDKKRISAALDKCLLTDNELAVYDMIVREGKNLLEIDTALQEEFEDGFEDWILYENSEEESEEASLHFGIDKRNENHNYHDENRSVLYTSLKPLKT